VLTTHAPDTKGVRHGQGRGYVAFVTILAFMCNVFLVRKHVPSTLSTPLIINVFGITLSQHGFAQTIANWMGLTGCCVSLLVADGFGRNPAFLAVLLGFSITAPVIGIAGTFLDRRRNLLVRSGYEFLRHRPLRCRQFFLRQRIVPGANPWVGPGELRGVRWLYLQRRSDDPAIDCTEPNKRPIALRRRGRARSRESRSTHDFPCLGTDQDGKANLHAHARP
jgi:hypothetical protein